MILPVSAVVAAICALMLLITAIDTVRHRVRIGAAFGDKGDNKLVSASRAHGNLAEHAPIVILMMAFLELSHASHTGLVAIGALFVAARAAHIVGLYVPVNTKPPLPRSFGVISTWLIMLILSGWTLWMAAAGA
jgi:uncharacterized membrane protein YecN with MAPEG domain